MLTARDENGQRLYYPLDVRDEAVRMADVMATTKLPAEKELFEMEYNLEQAIIHAKLLEGDNDYGTRRGNLETMLNHLKAVAKALNIVAGYYQETTIFDRAVDEIKEMEKAWEETE